MQLTRDGAEHHPAALAEPELVTFEAALSEIAADRPGTRLTGNPVVSGLLTTDATIGRLAAHHLGPSARPVRTLLFDKTAAQNWSLSWHQDRTIAVRRRIETPGFTN